LLSCDWEDKGPYTVTVSPPAVRKPVTPRPCDSAATP
jgi:hypothetical protein